MCMWYSLLQHTYVLIHYKHVPNTISRQVFLCLSIHMSTLLLKVIVLYIFITVYLTYIPVGITFDNP